MIKFIKTLFEKSNSINFTKLIKNGATVIDVRTKKEYKLGHMKGSVNIPLDTLSASISKLQKDKTIITCCTSGTRSASAKNILKSNGFTEVYNGGGWTNLQKKIK
jgi:phage shock protein E